MQCFYDVFEDKTLLKNKVKTLSKLSGSPIQTQVRISQGESGKTATETNCLNKLALKTNLSSNGLSIGPHLLFEGALCNHTTHFELATVRSKRNDDLTTTPPPSLYLWV